MEKLLVLVFLLTAPAFAQQPVLVLCYHDIVGQGQSNAGNDTFVDQFKNEMNDLYSQGYKSISMDEFYDHESSGRPLPEKALLLTFDDDYIGGYRFVFPLLMKMKWKATFFVHTRYVGVINEKIHMTWDQLKQMEQSPLFRVYSHTLHHPKYLTDLSDDDLNDEIFTARQEVEENLGRDRPYFAYPYGVYDDRVIDVTSQNYSMAFTLNNHSQNINPIYQEDRLGITKTYNLNEFDGLVKNWVGRLSGCQL